jgi:LacI family transcriptional regulator
MAKTLGCTVQRITVHPGYQESLPRWKEFINTLAQTAKDWRLPIGLIASGDELARTLVSELQHLGLAVPYDVAIIGDGNNLAQCTQLFPTLSSIDLGFQRIGYDAARVLGELMDGAAPPSDIIYVPPKELVVRDSTDYFAVDDKRVTAALRFMADNSAYPITVVQVAEAAAISQQRLNRLFHHYVGHTVNTELIRLRVEHFNRLLVESDEPLRVLAARSGFGTESIVYRTFKRQTGQTPSQYRAERRSTQ